MGKAYTDIDPEFLRVFRIDEMTGLFNRLYFMERVREDMVRSQRYGWAMTLVVLSVDDFETLVETSGRVHADQLLASVGTMIHDFFRDTDIVGRIDDAVFALWLPGTTLCGARTIANRLQDRATGLVLADETGNVIQGTCSLGIVEYDAPRYAEVPDLIEAAYATLAQAKATGPGQVAVAPRK